MARPKLAFLNDLVQAITGNERRGKRAPITEEAAARNALSRPASERLTAACDVLMGRIGEDIFQFLATTDSTTGGIDWIDGFDGAGVSGGDRINVQAIDANDLIAAAAEKSE